MVDGETLQFDRSGLIEDNRDVNPRRVPRKSARTRSGKRSGSSRQRLHRSVDDQRLHEKESLRGLAAAEQSSLDVGCDQDLAEPAMPQGPVETNAARIEAKPQPPSANPAPAQAEVLQEPVHDPDGVHEHADEFTKVIVVEPVVASPAPQCKMAPGQTPVGNTRQAGHYTERRKARRPSRAKKRSSCTTSSSSGDESRRRRNPAKQKQAARTCILEAGMPSVPETGDAHKFRAAAEVGPSKSDGTNEPEGRAGENAMGTAENSGQPGGVALTQYWLAEGVDVFTYYYEATGECRYEVHNSKLAILRFTLDTRGSCNTVCPAWNGKATCTVEVEPLSKQDLGTLEKKSPEEVASIQATYSWEFRPLDRNKLEVVSPDDLQSMHALADQMRQHGILASRLGSADAIIAACKAAGVKKFIDVEFFPNNEALVNNIADPNIPPLIWRRAPEVMGSPMLFHEGIKATDIIQGALGDCWFLASLAALAEYPDMIKGIFSDCEVNEFGVYQINCMKDGRPTKVVVDDYFPCLPGCSRFAYSQNVGNELWVLLLEKAWAKIHGSYEQIEGGQPFQAMMDLTGCPGRGFRFDQESERIQSGVFFEMLKECADQGCVMAASAPAEDRDNTGDTCNGLSAGGIIPGHAYTILQVRKVKGVSLVELRNPWGKHEWEGDWSDMSVLWDQNGMKQEVQPLLKLNDGAFWMCDRDFFKVFESVHIVYTRCRDSVQRSESRTPLWTTEDEVCGEMVEFEVAESATGFITLSQKDCQVRGSRGYVPLAFAVYGPMNAEGMAEGEVLRSQLYSDGVRELVCEVTQESPLMPGKYYVVIFNAKQCPEIEANVIVHMDGCHDLVANTQLVPMSPDHWTLFLLVSAVAGQNLERHQLGLETYGCFMPHGLSFALAVHLPLAAWPVNVDFDFGQNRAYRMIGCADTRPSASIAPGSAQLVGEFILLEPSSTVDPFCYSLTCSVDMWATLQAWLPTFGACDWCVAERKQSQAAALVQPGE